MSSYHRVDNMRLRVDDDGTAALEVVMPTTDGEVDVIAEWQVDYLPDEVQQRLRGRLDAPGLDVSTNKPDSTPGTHPS